MINVTVRHSVADFDTWKTGFDGHEAARRAHGATGAVVNRVVGSPNEILIKIGFSDLAGAEAFLGDPSLKEAMAKAGVTSAPDIIVAEQVEAVEYSGASA